MIKSKTLIFFLLGFFGLSVWSCVKENKLTNYDITQYQWEVTKIKNDNNVFYKNADEIYILKFESDDKFSINLDVNSCSGIYSMSGDNSFSVESLACTEICCDSEFAEIIPDILVNAIEYYTTENELHILGNGEIIFNKYEK